eukprot:15365586-Ditylum_brightwellii.AAC.2
MMHLYEMTEHPEHVDIVGTNDIQDEMKSLPIGTYCTVVTSAAGKSCLGLFHNYVCYCKGKSILPVNQPLAFGIKSYPKPKHFGGKQKIVINGTYVFKSKYKVRLSYLPLEYPSNHYLEELPHVDFCSPREWKPDEENNNNEDKIWFDSLEDEKELKDSEFLDSRD